MITAFVFHDGSLTKSILSGTANLAVAEALPAVDNLPSHVQAVAEHAADTLTRDVVWVDLCNPTPSEIASIERAFHMEVPTREEMGEIEASSRLYTENGALVMTAPILHRATAEIPGERRHHLHPAGRDAGDGAVRRSAAVRGVRAAGRAQSRLGGDRASTLCWGCWRASPIAWPTCWSWRRPTWSRCRATSSPSAPRPRHRHARAGRRDARPPICRTRCGGSGGWGTSPPRRGTPCSASAASRCS